MQVQVMCSRPTVGGGAWHGMGASLSIQSMAMALFPACTCGTRTSNWQQLGGCIVLGIKLQMLNSFYSYVQFPCIQCSCFNPYTYSLANSMPCSANPHFALTSRHHGTECPQVPAPLPAPVPVQVPVPSSPSTSTSTIQCHYQCCICGCICGCYSGGCHNVS